ncbi:predicted protein [Coccidioides posadasii str. Silveira]|uniref:Predicted protein n=2 Tax=Coccidioides posadasii TaxID=199306 RepID=E9D0K6_COCPS|nr:predicted protein [Coccidioides posadasii str. Silveira]KMM73572.1 hypothetical protein CPAG_09858 [Coccidioides posadasii RMSCC 3488]
MERRIESDGVFILPAWKLSDGVTMMPVRQDPHTPPRPINPPSARYGPSHWSSTAKQHATPGADQRARFVVSTCIAASADHQHIRFDDGEGRVNRRYKEPSC